MRKSLVAALVVTSLVAAMVVMSAGRAAADPPLVDFSQRTDIPIAGSPAGPPAWVAVGDLNGDGHLDLAVADPIPGSGAVSVLLGDGTGSFGPQTDFSISDGADGSAGPYFVSIGDLNGDGHLDLAVACTYANVVSVLLGDGTGSFGPHTDFQTGGSPSSVAIGDLNGDGHLDLAVTDSDAVSVLLGDGTGSFGPYTLFSTGGAFVMSIGDLNGDGHLDLAGADPDSDAVSVLLGDGTGSFGPPSEFATGSVAYLVAIGDLNGDGHLDLVAADYGSGAVSVLLGDGTGSFGAHTDFATVGSPVWLAVGDLNGDGLLDVAVTYGNSWPDELAGSVLLGDGTGSFGAHIEFTAGYYASSVAIGDLNGDGRPDLAVVAQDSYAVSVLLNAPAVPKAPGPPTVRTVTAGNQTATISWNPPVSDGFSPITGYVVTPYIGGTAQSPVAFDSIATTQTVTGLTNGATYTFTVAAINALGTGPNSAASNPVTPATVPGAPTLGQATVTDRIVTVQWGAPGSDGGSPITGYKVTPYIDDIAQSPVTFMSTATTETIKGLTNGATYTFTVAAINAVGTGPASEHSNFVTVAPTAPGVPTILRNATAGNQSATVSWLAPASDGGSPITGYVVTAYVGYAPVKVRIFNSPLTTQTVTGLTNGTTYRFRVRAYNAYGISGYSTVTNAVTPTP
jgi:hypothetical protein